jgi:TRAP-type C4-dicarboxylate transport system permease small subunit
VKELIRSASPRTVAWIFGGIYAVALAFAIMPPLYLWGSGVSATVFGVPFSIMYWIFDALLLGLCLWALYLVEDIRGELDELTLPVAPGEA